LPTGEGADILVVSHSLSSGPIAMEPLASLNGEILPASEAKVPIWDRGFLFADSIYEVMRLYSGRMWLEREHFGRLNRSLKEMQFPSIDEFALRGRIDRLIHESGVAEGTVYIHITRGVAPRRHAFPDPPLRPTELIVVQPYDDKDTAVLRETGVATIFQPDLRWGRCDVKSTNLLANCLANTTAQRQGAYEAILVRNGELVTEATHSSLLWVVDGRLYATPEGPKILPGTTRQGLPGVAGVLPPILPGTISPGDLLKADEVILTGTTIEVLPVTSIDGHPIGDGRPGPVTRSLQSEFRRVLSLWLATDRPSARTLGG
jgi:D-alanine transaminase